MGNVKFVKTLKLFFDAREGPSGRQVRFSRWNVVFLYAAAVIMVDMRMVGLEGSFKLFGFTTMELVGYAIGILVYVFLPSQRILDAGRIGGVLALGSLIVSALAPQSMNMVVYACYSFAGGLCIGCAFYAFFFAMNNMERFVNIIIIQLYFAVCVYGLWENLNVRLFFSEVLVYAFVLFFLASVFTAKRGLFPKRSEPKARGCGSEESCCRVGKSGMGVIFFVYVIYKTMEALNRFIVQKDADVTFDTYSVGAGLSIVIAIVIILLLGRSTLLIWKVFLIGSLASIALLAIDSIFDIKASSLLYGLANSLGYIAIFYLIGGAGHLTGCMKFFRVLCIIKAVLLIVLDAALDRIFAGIDEQNTFIALGLMIVIVCATFALYTSIYKKIFESDWIGDVQIFKPGKAGRKAEEEAEPDRTEGFGLTPREKQIFGFLLTEMSVKQIMIELEISKGTFNFHNANLYRKLGIQSRTELFAKFGR